MMKGEAAGQRHGGVRARPGARWPLPRARHPLPGRAEPPRPQEHPGKREMGRAGLTSSIAGFGFSPQGPHSPLPPALPPALDREAELPWHQDKDIPSMKWLQVEMEPLSCSLCPSSSPQPLCSQKTCQH